MGAKALWQNPPLSYVATASVVWRSSRKRLLRTGRMSAGTSTQNDRPKHAEGIRRRRRPSV
eukprot:13351051-Alexandrium_andersonii.AAC.1